MVPSLFLSKCWGGRATDKFITMNNGFLGLLEHGDVVLADRETGNPLLH